MRLLNVHTLEFSEDLLVDIPRYVIASHRWFPNTEATLEEVHDKRNTDKAGYKKVEGFAAYVRTQIPSVQWIWIDTCCINKRSEPELSEAINSMYKWYRNAEVCLAYLADVEKDDDLDAFRQSEWFGRGWTLQELLAPRKVLFLTRTWEVIGHKGNTARTNSVVEFVAGPSLAPSIAASTGIPEAVLNGFDHGRGFTVGQKLAWMAGRKTTREEDMSYCLLGIFDLTMAVRYGEGGEKARGRLLTKIQKARQGNELDNLSTETGPAKRPEPVLNVPFRRDPNFVYRRELTHLEDRVLQGRDRTLLVGLGGVGKSQLAIEFCYRLQERSPNTWILWIHASSAARFDESIRRLADDIDILGRESASTNIFRLAYEWLRDARNGKWMIVLDNVDYAEFLYEPLEEDATNEKGRVPSKATRTRIDCLPSCKHGTIVVTSRSRAVAAKMVDDADVITIGPMGEEDALVLLEKKSGQPINAIAADLVAALEYMPLAIAQASAYIKKRAPRCSIAEYLEKFERSDKSRTSLLNVNSEELRRDRDAENSILSTWHISFEYIYQLRRSAADLLSLMSFFDYQSIPESLIRDGYDYEADDNEPGDDEPGDDEPDNEDDGSDRSSNFVGDESFENDIVTLRDFHFISVAPTGRTFEMHRLVQLAAQKWLRSQGRYERSAAQSVRNLDLATHSSNYEHWTKWQVMLPHAKLALHVMVTNRNASIHRASVLYKAACFISDQKSAAEATEFARSSLESTEKLLGSEHPRTLSVKALFASLLAKQGKYEVAEKIFQEVVTAKEKVLGVDHPSTLRSVGNLAISKKDQGESKEAEAMLRQVIERLESVVGKESHHTMAVLNQLATVLSQHEKGEEAVEMSRRSLEWKSKVFGKDHPETLESLFTTARALRCQGKYEEAEAMHRQALEGRQKVLGKEHPETLKSLSAIASTLFCQEKYEEAETMNRQALEGRERVLGKNHPETLSNLDNLAKVLMHQGKYEEADEMSRRALQGLEQALGSEHPNTLTSAHNLAYLLEQKGDYHEALELYERAYSGYIEVLGQSHPDTMVCSHQLEAVRGKPKEIQTEG